MSHVSIDAKVAGLEIPRRYTVFMSEKKAPRIAIADNDVITIMGLSALLERYIKGASIVWKTNCGRKAIMNALDPSQKADILLLDISMSDISGVNVCRLLRRKGCNIPILAVTSFPVDWYEKSMIGAGAQGIVSKSETQLLIKAIQEILIKEVFNNSSNKFETTLEACNRLKNGEGDIVLLSDRERQTVEMFAHAMRLSDIATKLKISVGTVQTNLVRAQKKLKVNSRMELVAKWWESHR